MSQALPDIDFEKIIPRGGSKRAAFEELCVQLFSIDRCGPSHLTRVRGDGGDGGVEAYWSGAESGVFGLQAKYLFTLKSKKAQLDKSIQAALKTFPNLASYIFVFPFDRTPKQIGQWESWVDSWKRTARDEFGNGTLNIEWCGASKVQTLLHKRSANGLLLYYFGHRDFNAEWLRERLNAAIEQLDTRYTPDINIETSAAGKVLAFLGRHEFRELYYSAAKKLCEDARWFWREFPPKPPDNSVKQDAELDRISEQLRVLWRGLYQKLGEGDLVPDFAQLSGPLQVATEAINRLVSRLGTLEYAENPKRQIYPRGPWSDRYYGALKFEHALADFQEFLERNYYWGKRFLLLSGDAGSGKSHLIADMTRKHSSGGAPCLLLLGETFVASGDLWEQTVQRLGWSYNVDSLLALLNAEADASGQLGLIVVDAINECDDRRLWQKLATTFCSRLNQYRSLRLILTCRSDFLGICLPISIVEERADGWARLDHVGFDINMFQAVQSYFRKYQVSSEHFPPYLPEFSNPLFLKTVCTVYEGQRLPVGPISLSHVFREQRKRVECEISRRLDRDESLIAQAIDLIVAEMQKRKRSRIPVNIVKEALDRLLPAVELSKSLYAHLRSSGLFVELGESKQPNGEIRFQFERFYDFFVADKILSEFTSLDEAIKEFQMNGALAGFLSEPAIIAENHGLIGAFSILFPERFRIEYASLSTALNYQLMRPFIESLKWRNAESIAAETEKVFQQFQRNFCADLFYELLPLAGVPDHPFNADWAHRILSSKSLPQRDASWTWTISTNEQEEFEPNRFVHWAANVPLSTVPEKQAWLVSKMLAWFFASTRIQLRDDATQAAIRLLRVHPLIACKLIEEFGSVNDPYIHERVYAVAAGVALGSFDRSIVRQLARTVYDRAFSSGSPPPHILLRDYARTVLEKAKLLGALPPGVQVEQFRPPYKGDWPKIRMTPEEIEQKASLKEYETLCDALKENGHKNFGSHMAYVVEHFSNTTLDQPPPPKDWTRTNNFDPKVAKCFLFQRIIDLGWEAKLFPDESTLYEDERGKIEHVRQKYQRIALHEFLSYLSDHYHLNPAWQDDSSRFEGAWQAAENDFDPSLSPEFDKVRQNPPQDCWWFNYPNPLHYRPTTSHSAWLFDENVPDAKPLLTFLDTRTDRRLLALTGYGFWDESQRFSKDATKHARKKSWVHYRSWLIESERLQHFLKIMKGTHFYGSGIELPNARDGWLAEYPWGKAYSWLQDACGPQTRTWLKDETTPAAITGCHITPKSLLVPSPQVLQLLKASWSGKALDYSNAEGDTVAWNPSIIELGPEVLLVDQQLFLDAIYAKNLSLVWTLVGERELLGDFKGSFPGAFEFSGVYYVDGGRVAGSITQKKRIEPR